MAAESDFLKRAEKAAALSDRLERLFGEGRISEEKRARGFGALKETLSSLKAEHLALIVKALAEIDALQKTVPDEPRADVAGTTAGRLSRKDLILKRGELESEKDMIELCGPEEYVLCLKRTLESKKYGEYWKGSFEEKLSQYRASGEDESIPVWLWTLAAVMVAATFSGGLVVGSFNGAIISVASLGVYVIVGIGLLHLATVLEGIGGASYGRAFNSFIWYLPISAAAILIWGLVAVFAEPPIISQGMNAIYGSQLMAPLMFTLIIVTLLVLFVIPVFSVASVYELSLWDALKVMFGYYCLGWVLKSLFDAFLAISR
jgi:hypothetical protein